MPYIHSKFIDDKIFFPHDELFISGEGISIVFLKAIIMKVGRHVATDNCNQMFTRPFKDSVICNGAKFIIRKSNIKGYVARSMPSPRVNKEILATEIILQKSLLFNRIFSWPESKESEE